MSTLEPLVKIEKIIWLFIRLSNNWKIFKTCFPSTENKAKPNHTMTHKDNDILWIEMNAN